MSSDGKTLFVTYSLRGDINEIFGMAYDGGTTGLGPVRLGSTPSIPTRIFSLIKPRLFEVDMIYFGTFCAKLVI